MCSYLAVSKKVSTAMGLGIAVTFVLAITVPVNYLLENYVLNEGALIWLSEDFATVDLSFLRFIMFIAIIAFLYYISLHSYLLFHTLAEFLSITIAFSLFILSWNSWKFNTNKYILFLGIAFLFIGGLDLVHTMSYKGMNIFAGYDANLPTQLWIAARYLECFTLLIAPFMLNRNLKPKLLILIYSVAFLALLITILLRIFPICYVEGYGLTQFKKISEYFKSVCHS